MHPPKGMVSPRGPVFAALIERVEAPDPNTVVIHAKGPSGLLLPLFANGWSTIIPKHITEKDPVNALKTRVIGTDRFASRNRPPRRCGSTNATRITFRKIAPFSMRSKSILWLTPSLSWRPS